MSTAMDRRTRNGSSGRYRCELSRHGRPAGRRCDPARYRVAGGAGRPARRHFHHPCARRSCGRVGPSLDEAGMPGFARPFTAIHAGRKLEEAGQAPEAILRICEPYPAVVEAGPFSVQFAPISHSIPEASGLVIDTPAGRVVHSGDFKIDAEPGRGRALRSGNVARDRRHGAFWPSSATAPTCLLPEHEGRSESQLAEPIGKLIAGAQGMVVATTFASNVARLKTLAEAGAASGRTICLLGRAMKRMVDGGGRGWRSDRFPARGLARGCGRNPARKPDAAGDRQPGRAACGLCRPVARVLPGA